MTQRSILKLLALLSLLVIFSPSVSAQDCPTTTDDQLVDSIKAKMKEKYASQMKHINVRAKEGVVTIEGWTTTKKIKGEIEKLAKKVKCVKKFVNSLTIGVGGGCGPGMKPCGTICIPEEEKCNITEEGNRPQAPTPTPIKPRP